MDIQINSRIKTIMEYTELSPSDFSAAISITRSNLSHILSGRNQPSFSMLEKILKAFPEIRTEWLVTGLGDMLRDEAELAETVAVIEQNPLPHTQFEMNFDEEIDEPEPVVNAVAEPTAEQETVDSIFETPVALNSPQVAAKNKIMPVEENQAANLPQLEPIAEEVPNPAPVTLSRPVSRQNSSQKTRVQRQEVRQQPKKVKKIVYFYTDNSFEEYFPS